MNNTTLAEVYDDERRHSSTVYTSKLDIGLNCFSSVLSAISSIALIVIFLRSDKRLSSVYHRRIMSIAVATLITSLAMAFSTLPMPKDMIYTAFEGIVAGSTLTCDIQYFFISLGSHSYYWFILILALYYVSRIVFNMSESRFKKRIEIPMHVIAAVYSVSISSLLVIKQISNPTPNTPPYCNAFKYPYWCDEEECTIRGSLRWIKILHSISTVFGPFIVGSVFICLILTVFWVYTKERNIASLRRDYDVSNDIDVLLNKNVFSTRASFIQAMCYLLVYCLKSLFIFISLTSGLENLSRGLQIFHCLINPLDGFFNALIFVSIEVHNLRMAEASGDGQKSSLLETLWRVVKQGDTSNVAVISHLSIVCDDKEAIVHVKEEDGQITQSKFSMKHDYSIESIAEDFNDDGFSYPSNNISSGSALSHNVSITKQSGMDTKNDRNNISKQYRMHYSSQMVNDSDSSHNPSNDASSSTGISKDRN